MPELLPYTEENLRTVITGLLSEVSQGNQDIREQLLDPQKAKDLLLTRIERPDDWDQRVFAFQDITELNSRFILGVLPRIGEDVELETNLLCSWRVTPH